MTDSELETQLKVMVGEERKITAEILRLITLAEERGIPLRRGHSGTIDWLVEDYGYSESAAYRRVQASRLIRTVPGAETKLLEGRLSLSNLAKTQSVLKRHERLSGEKLDEEIKAGVVQKIENQTGFQAERTLMSLLPDAAESLNQDRLRRLDGERSRLSVTLDERTIEQLERVRALVGDRMGEFGWGEVIEFLANHYLHSKDPLNRGSKPVAEDIETQPSTTAVKQSVKVSARKTQVRRSPHVPGIIRKSVWRNAKGQCQFTDELSGRRCRSRQYLEIDHIRPRALGGSNEFSNLRLLCRAHNQYSANQVFGKEFMERHRQGT